MDEWSGGDVPRPPSACAASPRRPDLTCAMVRGCLFDLLRFLLAVLGALCVALWLGALWLGPEHAAVFTASTSPTTEAYLRIHGPSPDVALAVWERHLVLHTDRPIVRFNLLARPIALATIALCVLLLVLGQYDRRTHS